jgi:hypothetical protein
MPDRKVKELLTRLHQELENTDTVDEETLSLVKELDADIQKLVDSSAESEAYDSVVDRARSLETRFAVNHPVAERFLAEIMATLSRLGI